MQASWYFYLGTNLQKVFTRLRVDINAIKPLKPNFSVKHSLYIYRKYFFEIV